MHDGQEFRQPATTISTRCPGRRRARLLAILASFAVAFASATACADEGLWTFNRFPAQAVRPKYGFAPDKQWLEHVRLSSVRIVGGCSAAIVSPNGLVATNYHCVSDCVSNLSALSKRDFARDSFYAAKLEDERPCEGMELDQLLEITDVTERVLQSTGGAAPERFVDAQRAVLADVERECATSADMHCEVVALHGGLRFELYRYRRFSQVRLVFSPEESIAEFGGDPDNFHFPRFNLDVAFLRIVSVDGQPIPQAHWLAWSTRKLTEGDVTFVAGNPGRTTRGVTREQREDIRDFRLMRTIASLAELRGLLLEYMRRGPAQRRQANDLLNSIENWLKLAKGQHEALSVGPFYSELQEKDLDFRTRVRANPTLEQRYGPAFERVAATLKREQQTRAEFSALEQQFRFCKLFMLARGLVRHATEIAKPDGERLREYTQARLPRFLQKVRVREVVFDDLEIALTAWSLSKMLEELGPEHPAVKRALGSRTALQVAQDAVRHTRLKEMKLDSHGRLTAGLRKRLLEGGPAAIEASRDPMIVLARAIDAEARAVRRVHEIEIEGPMQQQEAELSRARFEVYGDRVYPEGTSSLRLSYGAIEGYVDRTRGGVVVAPFASIGEAFARHTGADPFALPRSWLAARERLRSQLPFNFVTTNDVVGGNSGSPVINAEGELIGLEFDANWQAVGNEFGYDESTYRMIAVDARAVVEALQKVYRADRIVHELLPE